ncbi:SCO family protein [Mangrovibrevibacter kandeliae]|uniref:SCO family protein n=1 Tax=Mangrovibrevibacter kandeliae TaxID=2968473 RepID=UPI00274271B8|nr:SCO family protein [Aurantimonas sp. CSK15Z-1]
MRPIAYVRLALWVVVALLAGATAALYFLNTSGPIVASEAPYGTPFQLVDQDGKPISDKDLRGRPAAIFFGFTHCPEVCPTTLAEMANFQNELQKEGRRLPVYFVTVDPERDSPAVMKDYTSALSPDITGITGDPPTIAEMLKGWGIYARKVPQGDDYTMDHTASVFLLDAEGRLKGTIAYGEDQASALDKLERLTAS